MTVYLGDIGSVEIRRTAFFSGDLSVKLEPEDVVPARKRFSFGEETSNALITGDQLEIETVDGSNLELVAGHIQPDGRWFIHVDDVGGLRLYNSFEDALNGEIPPALDLVTPSAPQQIRARTRNSLYRCVSQMRSWEMSTARETVDLTVLGEEHRRQYGAGLISGQGNLNCFWDYQRALCDPMHPDLTIEEPHYFAQLVLRLQQGARFDGRFYLKHDSNERSLWWEAVCIVTNVGFSFSPGAPVETQIQFVTTGPIALKTGYPPAYLLQEDGDLIRLENDEQDGHLLLDAST